MVKFKLLVKHPELSSLAFKDIKSDYLEQVLGIPLKLPNSSKQAFIFSCFATSVDGRLCYPDLRSGFAIAKNNLKASNEEQFADWWNLTLGRTISDAVIVGSNSLLYEDNSYYVDINIAELKQVRKSLNKPEHLLHIVITRDINKINFSKEILCQDNDLPVLIYCLGKPQQQIDNFTIKHIDDLANNTSLDNPNTLLKQIIYSDNQLDIKLLINKLYQTGIKTILNESPFYHHELQKLEMLNEAWLNTSGVYIGGNVASLGQNNSSFLANNHPHYSILTLHTLGYNFIYSRYKIDYR